MKVTKKLSRIRRHGRVRSRISGDAKTPRLSVYRSNKNIYVQIIDDSNKDTKTIFGMSDKNLKGTKSERALALGKEVAKAVMDKGIKSVLFDRGGYKYHGRVQAVAAGAREAGLKI